MELFYKYCDYNATENVEIENKESSCEEAMAERQRENESEELEETEFPLRESEQEREPSGPLPKQHYSINEWGDHMRQAEISKDFDKYKEMNPMVSNFTYKLSSVILHRFDYLYTQKMKISKACSLVENVNVDIVSQIFFIID